MDSETVSATKVCIREVLDKLDTAIKTLRGKKMKDEERLIWGKFLSVVATSRRQELEALDELLDELGKPFTEEEPKAEKPTLEEVNFQKWTDKTSEKGPYQTTSKTDNQNSTAFQKLQTYINKHGGFVILHGFKIWTFSNNQEILGRRRT